MEWQQLVYYSSVDAFLLYANGKLDHSNLCEDDLREKIGDHLCIERQCHKFVSMKSCDISNFMCEVAALITWPLTDLLLLLKPGTS